MKTPVGLVTAALSAATLFVGTLAFVTGTRGQNSSFESSAGQLEVQTFASGLVHPWALAFLPDGRLLVTERPGRMRIVSAEGQLSPPLKNVPEAWAIGQGGLQLGGCRAKTCAATFISSSAAFLKQNRSSHSASLFRLRRLSPSRAIMMRSYGRSRSQAFSQKPTLPILRRQVGVESGTIRSLSSKSPLK